MATFTISTDAYPGSEVLGTYDPVTDIFDDATALQPHRWTAFQTVEPVGDDSAGIVVEVQPEQSADFTATAGSDGVIHEWPVDMSAYAPGGILNVASPASPSEGDRFAVFDSRLVTDDGVVFPAENRNIRINFTSETLHSLPAPDFAVINTAGARIDFLFVGGSVGCRVASNVNY